MHVDVYFGKVWTIFIFYAERLFLEKFHGFVKKWEGNGIELFYARMYMFVYMSRNYMYMYIAKIRIIACLFIP